MPEQHAGCTHSALTVAHRIDAMASIEAAGYRIAEGHVIFFAERQAIFVRDPNGNVAELNQPLP